MGALLTRVSDLFTGSFIEGFVFNGIYSDLTPEWYRTVGRTITITLFSAPVINRLLTFVQWPTAWVLRNWATGSALNQQALNEAYGGPDFGLSDRYRRGGAHGRMGGLMARVHVVVHGSAQRGVACYPSLFLWRLWNVFSQTTTVGLRPVALPESVMPCGPMPFAL